MKDKLFTWIPRALAAVILGMGGIGKFIGGAEMFAEVLPGGATSAYLIGVAELVAAATLLVPRTAFLGAALGSIIMAGAVLSHLVGPVGMEGELGGMLPMAGLGLSASVIAALRSRSAQER